VTEDVGPVTAVKRSTRVLCDTWGTSLRPAIKGDVIAFALWLVPGSVLVIAVVMVFAGPSSVFAPAVIYRYAVGLPTPGIDTRVLADAFRSKG
jgi:hypothetical protein